MAVTRFDSVAAALVAATGALSFVSVLFYQGYVFLRYGFWPSVTLFSLAEWAHPPLGQAITPTGDWIGLKQVVEWFNGGFLVMVACFLAAATFNSESESLQ